MLFFKDRVSAIIRDSDIHWNIKWFPYKKKSSVFRQNCMTKSIVQNNPNRYDLVWILNSKNVRKSQKIEQTDWSWATVVDCLTFVPLMRAVKVDSMRLNQYWICAINILSVLASFRFILDVRSNLNITWSDHVSDYRSTPCTRTQKIYCLMFICIFDI